MKYNKEQRHEIYKQVLGTLPHVMTGQGCYSICFTLLKLITPSSPLYNFKIPKEFEELLMFRPSKRDDYWFDGKDLQSRQIVLEFCIEMTKP